MMPQCLHQPQEQLNRWKHVAQGLLADPQHEIASDALHRQRYLPSLKIAWPTSLICVCHTDFPGKIWSLVNAIPTRFYMSVRSCFIHKLLNGNSF